MNILILKSVSVGDILYAHNIGNWQWGSNGKSGPVGYANPAGSLLIIKCLENKTWYIMGLTSENPHTIPQEQPVINWPSFEDMAKSKDYVAQVRFFSRTDAPKIYTEEELTFFLGDLSKYKIAGVIKNVEDDIVQMLMAT